MDSAHKYVWDEQKGRYVSVSRPIFSLESSKTYLLSQDQIDQRQSILSNIENTCRKLTNKSSLCTNEFLCLIGALIFILTAVSAFLIMPRNQQAGQWLVVASVLLPLLPVAIRQIAKGRLLFMSSDKITNLLEERMAKIIEELPRDGRLQVSYYFFMRRLLFIAAKNIRVKEDTKPKAGKITQICNNVCKQSCLESIIEFHYNSNPIFKSMNSSGSTDSRSCSVLLEEHVNAPPPVESPPPIPDYSLDNSVSPFYCNESYYYSEVGNESQLDKKLTLSDGMKFSQFQPPTYHYPEEGEEPAMSVGKNDEWTQDSGLTVRLDRRRVEDLQVGEVVEVNPFYSAHSNSANDEQSLEDRSYSQKEVETPEFSVVEEQLG